MMLFCCCSKSREDSSGHGAGGQYPTEQLPGFESKQKNLGRILIEFITEEQKLGVKNVQCIDMVERVLLASNKEEISKKEVVTIYKSIESVNQQAVKHFLVQDFFFTDNTRSKYDFSKVLIFNLLYTGGSESEKSSFLFNLVESSTTGSVVHCHSHKLLSALECLAFIPCVVVGEILHAQRRFENQQEEEEFLELLQLYTTNSHMLREFALHIESTYFSPLQAAKQYLSRTDFFMRMEECQYLVLKPNEIRKKYTEFVMFNKSRALLPSRKTFTGRSNDGAGISRKVSRREVDKSMNSLIHNVSIDESLINLSQKESVRDMIAIGGRLQKKQPIMTPGGQRSDSFEVKSVTSVKVGKSEVKEVSRKEKKDGAEITKQTPDARASDKSILNCIICTKRKLKRNSNSSYLWNLQEEERRWKIHS